VTIERWTVNPPGLVPPDAPASRLALGAFERVLGERPLLLRTGGTLPIVPALSDRGIPAIVTGFAEPGHNIHAPNERLRAAVVETGVAAAQEALRALAALARNPPLDIEPS
jgi:acetylornithine deacetylase/succinyl-diaminopimelate desuccinylase-like protein